MKDLQKLADECISDLRKIGIEPGTINRWRIETNTTRRWGICKGISSGGFEIGISKVLLEDDVNDQHTKNTIMHELLHTVKGCSSHQGKWKNLAHRVNLLLPEYNIKRSASEEEKGIEIKHRYMLECTKCDAKIYRDKMCNVVKFPEKYKCSRCHSPLRRIR